MSERYVQPEPACAQALRTNRCLRSPVDLFGVSSVGEIGLNLSQRSPHLPILPGGPSASQFSRIRAMYRQLRRLYATASSNADSIRAGGYTARALIKGSAIIGVSGPMFCS